MCTVEDLRRRGEVWIPSVSKALDEPPLYAKSSIGEGAAVALGNAELEALCAVRNARGDVSNVIRDLVSLLNSDRGFKKD